jgi:hypothetical protein
MRKQSSTQANKLKILLGRLPFWGASANHPMGQKKEFALAAKLLPRWFTGAFLALVILIVIPMLTVWPLQVLGQKETPRPILELSDEALSTETCQAHITALFEQLEDYTGSTAKTARNQGGEFWLDTMRSWQSDVERVAARCQLKPLAQDADEKHKSLAAAYQTMLDLSNIYINSIEPLAEKSNTLLKTARESLAK